MIEGCSKALDLWTQFFVKKKLLQHIRKTLNIK